MQKKKIKNVISFIKFFYSDNIMAFYYIYALILN